MKGEANAHLIEDIPTGIYTIPEISSVGKTEQQLTAMKVPYEVGRAQFKHLARAQIVGMNVGTLKILFHRETKEILGIHCFGERAAEIIHIGQAIMEQKGGGNTIEYFVNTTFNYPTMAEASSGSCAKWLKPPILTLYRNGHPFLRGWPLPAAHSGCAAVSRGR